jgi:hypothetical protein
MFMCPDCLKRYETKRAWLDHMYRCTAQKR